MPPHSSSYYRPSSSSRRSSRSPRSRHSYTDSYKSRSPSNAFSLSKRTYPFETQSRTRDRPRERERARERARVSSNSYSTSRIKSRSRSRSRSRSKSRPRSRPTLNPTSSTISIPLPHRPTNSFSSHRRSLLLSNNASHLTHPLPSKSSHTKMKLSPSKLISKNHAPNTTQLQSSPEEKEASPEKPNFNVSGKLTQDLQMVNGIVMKYNEPIEADIPDQKYCLVVFKGKETLSTIYLHKKSCFLFGRDRSVAEIPTDHPSCSKQHAVIQYRRIEVNSNMVENQTLIKPYLLDIHSTNGTFLNDVQLDPARYYELRPKDVLKFGQSSREYVFMNADSL